MLSEADTPIDKLFHLQRGHTQDIVPAESVPPPRREDPRVALRLRHIGVEVAVSHHGHYVSWSVVLVLALYICIAIESDCSLRP